MTCGFITLSGAAQNLGAALIANGQLKAAGIRPLRKLDLQPEGTNDNPIYIHHNNAISIAGHIFGIRLEAGDTSNVPPAPYVMAEFLNGPITFSDIWVIGTAGEFLHFLAIEF